MIKQCASTLISSLRSGLPQLDQSKTFCFEQRMIPTQRSVLPASAQWLKKSLGARSFMPNANKGRSISVSVRIPPTRQARDGFGSHHSQLRVSMSCVVNPETGLEIFQSAWRAKASDVAEKEALFQAVLDKSPSSVKVLILSFLRAAVPGGGVLKAGDTGFAGPSLILRPELFLSCVRTGPTGQGRQPEFHLRGQCSCRWIHLL
eukprot:45878-Rhodomonas_salina.1